MAKKVRDQETQIKRLRSYNLVAGIAHLGQAIGMLVIISALNAQAEFGVTADYMAGPPGSPIPPERVDLFTVNMGYGLVGFLGLSALFHFLVITPAFFAR